MEQPPIDSAQHYYNEARRKSFFYSRVFVIVSMLVLLVGLGVNITLLNTQQRTSTSSQAASNNNQDNLPSLPAGCEYHTQNKNVTIACTTPSPSAAFALSPAPSYPLSIDLPALPSQCKYQTSHKGYKVACQSLQTPIQTAVVSLPSGCVPFYDATNFLAQCTQQNGSKIKVNLPQLPEGCVYNRGESAFTITCNALTTF